MRGERGSRESRWYREGNAARFCPGWGRRVWVFPTGDGHAIAIIPAEFTAAEREAAFEVLLRQFWCVRYGLPEARARLLELAIDAEGAAD